MATPSFRTAALRIAAELPKGDPHRVSILKAARADLARFASIGQKVDAQELIEGYQDGPGRKLQMFGPMMKLRTWWDTMEQATPGGYNDFEPDKAFAWFLKHGILAVHPAREYSVAAYANVTRLPMEKMVEILEDAAGARADEVTLEEGSPDGATLAASWVSQPGMMPYIDLQQAVEDGKPIWLRVWWD
jgi:hypothetical protein